MIPSVKYVIYGCFSARETPSISLNLRLTLGENIVAVIIKIGWHMAIWKDKSKSELCVLVYYFYQPKFFNKLGIGQNVFSIHPTLC